MAKRPEQPYTPEVMRMIFDATKRVWQQICQPEHFVFGEGKLAPGLVSPKDKSDPVRGIAIARLKKSQKVGAKLSAANKKATKAEIYILFKNFESFKVFDKVVAEIREHFETLAKKSAKKVARRKRP